MKALVVGCGKVGSEIARDLASSEDVSSVVAADALAQNLSNLQSIEKVKTVRTSVEQRRVLRGLMEEADVVCGALPGRIGFQLLGEAVSCGKDIVDISYTPKNPLSLHRKAIANDCTLIPQCGIAPGFTNMCVGDASGKMDRIVRVRIFVGGLPQKPEPPLNYRVVFSLDDVINEYTRPVSVIENGTLKAVEPLTGRGILNFPGVGKLEYFLTDGLGTLPNSFPKVREMHELTLRYPGHAEIIDSLRRLGLFNRKPVTVNGKRVEPRTVTMEVLRQSFAGGSPEDLLAFRVEVAGVQHGRRTSIIYQMLDKFDRRRKASAMARTTAYPCTSVALLLGSGRIELKGVVPPEKIAREPRLFSSVLSRLAERGIRLRILARKTTS